MKVPIKTNPIMIVVERMRKTPRALDLEYLSMLSTACKNMVVNRKEKTNIPIIDERKGRISIERSPIIMNNNNL